MYKNTAFPDEKYRHLNKHDDSVKTDRFVAY